MASSSRTNQVSYLTLRSLPLSPPNSPSCYLFLRGKKTILKYRILRSILDRKTITGHERGREHIDSGAVFRAN